MEEPGLSLEMALRLKLSQVDSDIRNLDERRQQLMVERARLVRDLIAEEGWKSASKALGVKRARLYQIAKLWPLERG